MQQRPRHPSIRAPRSAVLVFLAAGLSAGTYAATTTSPNLADAPIGATIIVPANVVLDLSVEFPTAVSDAYYSTTVYTTATEFLGYFNPGFCYDYQKNTTFSGTAIQFGGLGGYFVPITAASADTGDSYRHTCSGHWSGNFLNWTMTQTIDPLRKALTGGARIVDTISTTILQKAYQDNQGGSSNQAVKSITTSTPGNSSGALVRGATPFSNWSTIYVNNLHTGLNFVFSRSNTNLNSNTSTGTDFTTATISSTNSSSGSNANYSSNNTVYAAQSAVQVCSALDAAGDLESNGGRCRNYAGNYKPVGLMQKYAAENASQIDSIRYSVLGYLLDSAGTATNQQLDGGVLRAKMKSVGPFQANPGATVVANSAAEWNAGTGVFAVNPNPSDASSTPRDASDPSSGVSNSGVINYLNKFGFASAANSSVGSAYKRFDSVSELYYMATRYYRHLGNLASHTTTAAAITSAEATNDNFPVITDWDDPITYSCSTNYIIGIGDIHTWNDANLPGSTLNGGYEVADAQVGADTGVNVKNATDFIANLEHLAGDTGGVAPSGYSRSGYYTPIATLGDSLIGSTPSPSGGWGASNNTFFMAGLAYDAHTRDIRPDITPKSMPVTVSTFWLDVMEGNDYHQKNQFWMTAKYGGFDTSTTSFPNGYQEYGQTAALPLSSWNTGAYVDDHFNYLPDQYYQASNPSAMAAGLNGAFAKIVAHVPSGTSTALALGSNTIASAGSVNYAVSFGKDWSGDVAGNQLAVTIAGGAISTTSTTKWHARDWLPNKATAATGVTPLTADTRIIATSSAVGAGKGIPFRLAGLGSAEASALGGNATQQANVLNYVRGDQSKEGTAPSFRPRTYTLGDITNSKPAVSGPPTFPYADAPLNPGYSAFAAAHAGRGPVIYVGANDGMLHAFDASITSVTGGKELFAYVPSFLFNTNTDPNGNPVGLASLVANPLQHHFMVDAQPTIIDVDFARTWASGSGPAPTAASDWHTLLVSGLGKGGAGFFALDVTDPFGVTTEAAAAGNVKWEMTASHMGYSYGTPLVVKTARYGWTVVLTSGYGNDDGQGYIYLVSPKDGTLYETISTGAGTLANPAGLAYVSGYINNYADFTADSLYAGDLLGNVWRIDLTNASSAATVQKFASLRDAAGNPQPVTNEPVIATDPSSQVRYVFVGTGRLLADTDLVSSRQQTFYSFTDGNNTAFDSGAATLTRSDLANDTASVVGGVTIAPTQRGYYIDLQQFLSPPAGQQAGAERVNVQPVASGGVVTFAANLVGQDACGAGSSRLFALGYDSGSGTIGNSLFTGASGVPVAALTSPAPVNSIALATDASGRLDVLAGTGGNGLLPSVFGGTTKKPAQSLKKLNWREVPTTN